MQKEVKKSWALFIGIGTMMIAHGLQLQVMGIRSVIENFSVITTGIFMSGYYIGYFVGSKTTPKLVSKVGHISCLLYTSPSPRDGLLSRMPSSA